MQFLRYPLFLAVIGGLSACNSIETMTAEQIGCETREVRILESQFKRFGSETTWCARCTGANAGGNYVCATNPSRERVECRAVPPGPPCE
jgi:hypothetical protein